METKPTHDLSRLYPYLAIYIAVTGIAISIKTGDWAGSLFCTLTTITTAFLIIFFVQRALKRHGAQAAWKILTFTLPALIIIWLIKGVMLLLK